MPSDLLSFLKWYLAITAFGLLALPLAFRFFRHLPDRGYTFARPLGLLTVCYAFWLLGSLGFLRNDVGGLLFAALLVGGLGLWWLGRAGWGALRAWLREQRAFVLGVEALFLLAFAGLAWVRAYNPEIVGTEKPMEYMFINSILRSPTFPPHDAWLSEHAISYYYFGYVMVASLARLTGTVTSVAFNLGLALLFALTAVGAFGVVLNLMALVKTTDDRGPLRETEAFLRPPSSVLRHSFWPALLGPLLVLVAGNFYGVVKIAHANGMFANLQVPAVRYDFGVEGAQAPGARAGWVNVWEWLDLKGANTPPPAKPPGFVWDPGFWWWFSGARVVHDRNLTGVETEAIDEMPAFSFVLGDMHPHVLALPFVVLAIGLALEWMLWGVDEGPLRGTEDGGESIFRLRDRLLISAILLGGLSFLNTWDFPIYWFLTTVALVAGLGLSWGWERVVNGWRLWGTVALALAALSVLLYLPFYLTFQSQAGGLLPNLIYPTRFQQTVVFFGPVLVGVTLFLIWLAARNRAQIDRRAAWQAGGGILAILTLAATALSLVALLNPVIRGFVTDALAPLALNQGFGLMLQRRLVDSFATLFPAGVIGLVVGLGVGGMRCAEEKPAAGLPHPSLRSPALLMALAMILTGALLMIGPEFVYLRDNFGTRMNTLFKFYFQTWTLWALASAFGLWYIWQLARPTARRVAAGAMSLATLAGLVYTFPALYSKTGHFAGPPTLDGMAYFAEQYPDDWAAIQWVEQNVPGAPVLAEGIGGQYWSEGRFSRISMATGLPTVMGWPGHEGQWRGHYIERVGEREGQIQALYQARDWATAQKILDDYDIEYVYVSALEQDKYRPVYLPKFDQHMRAVFQSGDVTIYQRLDSQAN